MQEMTHMIIIIFLLQFHVIKKILTLWQTVVIRFFFKNLALYKKDGRCTTR